MFFRMKILSKFIFAFVLLSVFFIQICEEVRWDPMNEGLTSTDVQTLYSLAGSNTLVAGTENR